MDPGASPHGASAFRDLVHLLPVLGLFVVVVGSIYAGIATPTEAAALGVLVAILLAAMNRRLSVTMMRDAIEGTLCTTAMIMLIIIAAYFLNYVLASVGLQRELGNSHRNARPFAVPDLASDRPSLHRSRLLHGNAVRSW